MAIIRNDKRGGGSWRARAKKLVDGKYRYLDKTFDSKQEAKECEAKWLYEINSGIALDESNMTFGEYAQNWLDNLVGVAPSTRKGYQYKLNNLFPHMKHLRIKEIKNTHIKNVMRKLKEKGYSARTMQHNFKIIKQVLDQALIDDVILRNPCATFKKTTNMKLEHHAKAKALSKDDQVRLIDHMKETYEKLKDIEDRGIYEHQVYVFTCIALYTGMRRGEIACLEWNDVDLDKNYIDVNKSVYYVEGEVGVKSTKTKAGIRMIKMDMRLAKIISEYKTAHKKFYLKQGIKPIHNWMFPTPNNELQQPNLWSHRICDAMKRLGMDHTLHELRHTHASNLLMYNFPLTELSMRLGHADPQITLRVYSHFVGGMESNIDEFMSKVGT